MPTCLSFRPLQLLAAVAEEDARPGASAPDEGASADPDWQATKPKGRGRPRKRRPASAGGGRQVEAGSSGEDPGRAGGARLCHAAKRAPQKACLECLSSHGQVALSVKTSPACATSPFSLPPAQGDAAPVQCGHCGTGETPRWWNLPTGTLCNACGIWLKRHGGWGLP